ncbi:phage tail protein [Chimaeribacter arupi]|uniref:phage tail-collar fiber domain-containing protein n=1 Tax=Chimaeribacter arupi TaxID=2060066 RepID=UPI0013FCFFAD
MTAKYYALLTNLGAAKLANAAALGTKLQITQMAVGDGGGALPTPNATQTALKSEKRRAALNTLSIDAANSSQIIAEQIIPEDEGGFWIREIGLFDADGALIAVANCPETYKPQLQEGSGRTQTVRMILIVNSTEAVTLKVDPAVVLATRKYVDDAVITVKAYTDNVMTKHLAAKDPHTQYLKTASQLSEIKAQGSAAMANALKNIGAMPFYATALNVDLDTLGPDSTGVYYKEIDSAAKPELHYPEKMSGTLLVILSGYGVQQEYTTRLGNKYVRGLSSTWNGNGPWRAWTPIYSSGNPPPYPVITVNNKTGNVLLSATDVGALPVIATSIGNTSIDAYGLDHLGIYQQSLAANVTTANGFPAAATAGGTLEVILGPYVGGVLQRYTEKHTGRTWSRTLTGNWNGSNGPWSAWAAMYSENNPPKASDVGALPLTGGSITESLGVGKNLNVKGDATVEGMTWGNGGFTAKNPDGYRLVNGDKGAFLRIDATNLYIMLTKSGDQYGTWNDLRPFTVELSTGRVSMNNGLSVQGDATVTGNFTANGDLVANNRVISANYVYAGGGTGYLAGDGNIYGDKWGGWLTGYLLRTYITSVRFGAASWTDNIANNVYSFGAGVAITGIQATANYATNLKVAYRPIQVFINNTWYSVNSL